MITSVDKAVAKALAEFQGCPFKEAACCLLGALGYRSDRSLSGPDSSPKSFLELFSEFDSDRAFNDEKALVSEWKTADLSVRMTNEFSRGYSVDNLEWFRSFYLGYPDLLGVEKSDAPRRILPLGGDIQTSSTNCEERWDMGLLTATYPSPPFLAKVVAEIPLRHHLLILNQFSPAKQLADVI